jgi:hypothetical protein
MRESGIGFFRKHVLKGGDGSAYALHADRSPSRPAGVRTFQSAIYWGGQECPHSFCWRIFLVLAALLLFAGAGNCGNEVITLAAGLGERPKNHHLEFSLAWSVVDEQARGGVFVRLARDAKAVEEPAISFFVPVSGVVSALPGGAALSLAQLAELPVPPRPGVHEVSIRVHPSAQGVRIVHGRQNTFWPDVVIEPADLSGATVLEVSYFGSGFHFGSAALGWRPSGSLLVLR